MDKSKDSVLKFAILVIIPLVITGIIFSMGIQQFFFASDKQIEEELQVEQVEIIQRDEEYYEEKELSESGLAREPDTEMTEQKIITLRETWGENDMRRMELNRNKPDNYQEMVIQEFESGKLSHIESCHDLNSYYLLYYGQVYGNQYDFSNNKLITDYLKERMWAIDCEFKEQAELKEKIDAEKQRVDEAVEKVMEELDEVYKEN